MVYTALHGGSTRLSVDFGIVPKDTLLGAPSTIVEFTNTALRLRPQIENSSGFLTRVVINDGDRIVLWPTNILFSEEQIAGTQEGFVSSSLGEYPGISPNGGVVAFTGNKGLGQGIYVSVVTTTGRLIIPMAGPEIPGDELTSATFPLDQRVGVVHRELATGTQVVTTAFAATIGGVPAVYVRSIEVSGALNLLAPRRVFGQGSAVGQKTVSSFFLYDPLNVGGSVVSFAFFSDGSSGIILADPYPYLVFREDGGTKRVGEGTWFDSQQDEIPGLDHVGLAHVDVPSNPSRRAVFESHPGYPIGDYLDLETQQPVFVDPQNGVQDQHSPGSFEHDSTSMTSTVEFVSRIPISSDLADQLVDAIRTQDGAGFRNINKASLSTLAGSLSPSAQKGEFGDFTCVGLIEWASESAGVGNGQGFVPSRWEGIEFPSWVPTIGGRIFPTLSPSIQHWALTGSRSAPGTLLNVVTDWIQGFFDPVDFILTDPIGRRVGHTAAAGTLKEIPQTFYTGDGRVEQLMILDPIPGSYHVDLYGVESDYIAAIGSTTDAAFSDGYLSGGSTRTISFMVHATDMDGDGIPNSRDTCPTVPDPNQLDDDNDGYGNVCDTCTSVDDVAQRDRDGDSVGDACDNCPDNATADQTNQDGDSLGLPCDCQDNDSTAWSTPSEVVGVELSHDSVIGRTDFSWDVPGSAGGVLPAYDVIRSSNPIDFVTSGSCVATDSTDRAAADSSSPSAGSIWYYLVRAQNACPGALGTGPLGTHSDGMVRTGRTCP